MILVNSLDHPLSFAQSGKWEVPYPTFPTAAKEALWGSCVLAPWVDMERWVQGLCPPAGRQQSNHFSVEPRPSPTPVLEPSGDAQAGRIERRGNGKKGVSEETLGKVT